MIPHEHISEKLLVAGLIVVAIAGLALASTGTSQLWNTNLLILSVRPILTTVA